ncbi:septal ring lytic transglycosylase RlpA family protein [Sphingomonadaceae bacterium]|nr:septal ring lytic transglycosylase RlpA family protein [Sphingomonadaceae bacterium]
MITGTKTARTIRTNAFASLAVCAALVAVPAGMARADDNASEIGSSGDDFAQEFIQMREPKLKMAAAAGAVDITEIDIPIEVEPETSTRSLGTGMASYYGRRFHGRQTANGERFDMNAMTAAHKTLPFGTLVEVTNPRNGRTVTVRINDRGPFIRGREIDLSRGAAQQVGLIQRGHGRVELAIVE